MRRPVKILLEGAEKNSILLEKHRLLKQLYILRKLTFNKLKQTQRKTISVQTPTRFQPNQTHLKALTHLQELPHLHSAQI